MLLLSNLHQSHPNIHLDCFSPIEIEGIAEVCELSTKEVLTKLRDSGMHGLPGGGAEMLVDDVRLDISPKKGSSSCGRIQEYDAPWLVARDLKLSTFGLAYFPVSA